MLFCDSSNLFLRITVTYSLHLIISKGLNTSKAEYAAHTVGFGTWIMMDVNTSILNSST